MMRAQYARRQLLAAAAFSAADITHVDCLYLYAAITFSPDHAAH